MEKHLIIWQKKAQKAFNDQMFWYYEHTNSQFAATFMENIIETVRQIASMPTIGRLEKVDRNKVYRSLPSHPKCRILYWYDEEEVHIVDLVFAARNR